MANVQPDKTLSTWSFYEKLVQKKPMHAFVGDLVFVKIQFLPSISQTILHKSTHIFVTCIFATSIKHVFAFLF